MEQKMMWDQIQLEDPGELAVSVGDLDLRVVRNAGLYRVHLGGGVVQGVNATPEGWRTLHVSSTSTLHLEPATPDLPVVLKPREPIAVAPGEEVSYRVHLPLWVRFAAEQQDARKGVRRQILLDVPSRRLKRTWFGTSEAGEVGYGWNFLPRAKEAVVRHRCVVPLTIQNASQSILWFERLLLRVVHLALYRVKHHVETNGVTVVFKGSEQLSQVSFESDGAMRGKGATLLCRYRVPANADIIRRSFLWLRDLTV